MYLHHHHRYSYSPINLRPIFNWPGNTRLAVYIALNLEHFSFAEGLGAKLASHQRSEPDILNYAWRDYGNRVGVWYLFDLFTQLELPITLLINSVIYDYCPQVVLAFRQRHDEIVAHGYTNSERQSDFKKQDEEELILSVTKTITQHEGKTPKGWLGPWISESTNTLDLLKTAGYEYVLDWCHDDQPTWLNTDAGKIVSIPYSQEINDIPTIIPNRASAAQFADMIVDQFDEMLRLSISYPLVFNISLHPYITGQPFRLKHLRRALNHIKKNATQIWLTHPGKIASYWQTILQ